MLDRQDQRGTPIGYLPLPRDEIRPARMPRPTDIEHIKVLLQQREEAGHPIVSVIGHPDTAAVISDRLGRDLPANRAGIRLREGDLLIVAQFTDRKGNPYLLPEGATTLPGDASLEWWTV